MHAPKEERKDKAVANTALKEKSNYKQGLALEDNRPDATAQRKMQAGIANNFSPQPIQRQIEFTDTAEKFGKDDGMKFVLAYGMSEKKEAIDKMIPWLTDGEPHIYKNIKEAISSLGIKEEIEKPKDDSISMVVKSVNGKIGSPPKVEAESILKLKKSKQQGSHPLYDVTNLSGKYKLKGEPSDKSGFQGMKAMENQEVEVPSVISLTLDDGKDYLLMDHIPHLQEGLSFVNYSRSNEEVIKAGYQLGVVHVTDISVANVDRLPWRGNKYTGHLFNVFQNQITGNVVGLDTEKPKVMTEDMEKDIALELNEIRKKTHDYAYGMGEILATAKDRNKITLKPEQLRFFADGFEAGLKKGLSGLKKTE